MPCLQHEQICELHGFLVVVLQLQAMTDSISSGTGCMLADTGTDMPSFKFHPNPLDSDQLLTTSATAQLANEP